MGTNNAEQSWAPVVTFAVATYAVTWAAFFSFRPGAESGSGRAVWDFILVTVWSPTIIAVLTAALFNGSRGVGTLVRSLFRRLAERKRWYVAALAVPFVTVCVAIAVARALHANANFVPLAALPVIMAIQLGTGAVGEELGWRGLFLSCLQSKLSKRVSAAIMGATWSLWHLPSFFMPGLPQTLIPPAAFLITVACFGIFLSLVFNETNGHVLSTMIAHFGFNVGLAIGGAQFGPVLWWSLTFLFAMVALWSGFRLGRLPGRLSLLAKNPDEKDNRLN